MNDVPQFDEKVSYATKPETIGNLTATAPMTGAEFLESIDDGREIYIYGERVRKVTEHPAFRNTARMIARLYDAMHDPELSKNLMVPTDTGSGGLTQAYFKAPRNVEESVAGRDAIAQWARLTYGWAGRAPDYKAAFPCDSRRQCGFLQPLSGECAALVQVQPGARAFRQPRDHPSADGPRQAAQRGVGRLRPR